MLHDLPHDLRRGRGNGDDDLVDLVFPADLPDPLVAPQDLQPLDSCADLGGIVVDKPHFFHPQGCILDDFPCDHLPGGTRSHDEHTPVGRTPLPAEGLSSRADHVSESKHDQQRVSPVQEVDRARDMIRPPQENDRPGEQERTEGTPRGDREDVPDRHVPPPAAEQAEGKEPERFGDEQHRDRLPHNEDVRRGDVEVEPDQVGKVVRGDEYRQVQQELHDDPVTQDEVQRAGKKRRHAGSDGLDEIVPGHLVPTFVRLCEPYRKTSDLSSVSGSLQRQIRSAPSK